MCPRTYFISSGIKEWAPVGFKDMDLELYKNIISQGKGTRLKSVKLNFLCEPLLHPQLVEMVSLASKAELWVMINTNASLLTKELSRDLLKAGLTDIFFSFDSPYPEEYEKIRRGAVYGQVLDNIKTFVAIKEELGLKNIQTRASMVLPEGEGKTDSVKED
jgi:MoaA/NifB/PqqE/SkfB family radical SAM enzyme